MNDRDTIRHLEALWRDPDYNFATGRRYEDEADDEDYEDEEDEENEEEEE
ncbi:MAG: hypothetical protein IKT33_03415 [Clostridia bacterium]|nr:hypothetical protein [Clostridia bacterium]